MHNMVRDRLSEYGRLSPPASPPRTTQYPPPSTQYPPPTTQHPPLSTQYPPPFPPPTTRYTQYPPLSYTEDSPLSRASTFYTDHATDSFSPGQQQRLYNHGRVDQSRAAFLSPGRPAQLPPPAPPVYTPPRQERLYKVPVDQRRANPDVFTPYLYSFGPYHALRHAGVRDLVNADNNFAVTAGRAADLLDGDHLKWKTVEVLQSALGDLEVLSESIQEVTGIQAQYVQWQQHVSASQTTSLAQILAVDAITIIAATMSHERRSSTPLIYPLARLVLNDAILLENQVPVIVLACALNTLAVEPWKGQQLSLESVISWYCKRANPFPAWAFEVHMPPFRHRPSNKEPLLAFLYQYITERLAPEVQHPPLSSTEVSRRKAESEESELSIPTASCLLRCGVKFRPCDTHISLDSKNGVLFLPRITVNELTLRVLHNLLAYEATVRHPEQYCLVSYLHFMDLLIDTASDAQILTDAGVVLNKLGSHEELASVWNKMCVSVSYRNTTVDKGTMVRLEMLTRKRWRKWKASFKEKYWEKQPWLLLSIIAATLLFVLTLLQTIFTILN